MPKNMGAVDKTLRIIVAAVLVALGLSGTITGTLAIVGYVVAAVFVLTSLVEQLTNSQSNHVSIWIEIKAKAQEDQRQIHAAIAR